MIRALLSIALAFLFSAGLFAQPITQLTFEQVTLQAEQDFSLISDARKLCGQINIPHTIYLPEGVFIEAKLVHEGRVIYTVINNIPKMFEDGEVLYWEDIQARYDLTSARLHYVNQPTQNPTLGYSAVQTDNRGVVSYLMVVESTNDAVMLLEPVTGDLLDPAYIVDAAGLSTPIEALLSPAPTILISNQLGDNVTVYDTTGAYLGVFVGGNTSILDNIRGQDFTPGFNSLVVTVGGGANSNAVAEFDPGGNYVGNFIDSASGGLLSPFDITFRATDCLVAGINSDAIHSYDLNGNPLSVFAPINNFPEQVHESADGNVAVANFSGTQTGIVVLSSTGALLNVLSGITGNRGVYKLGNGNYLTTNGAGVHEVNSTTGTLVRTIVAGVSGRFISEFDLSIIPVELTSFTAASVNGNVVLNWQTATELNNSGFEIQRSTDMINFTKVAFVPGFGTTTETRSYTYTDNNVSTGNYYYRLKQVDFNGEFAYSEIVEVDVTAPVQFSLLQNYPNPFNPSTIISYTLADAGNVTLKVYDILGNEVATLVNSFQQAGKYNVNFDASMVAGGVYFYTINAGNFTDTKKMILVK